MAFSKKRKVNSIVGSNIRRIRKKKDPKMTHNALAKSVGLSRVSIINIEKGVHGLTVPKLVEMSKALGVPYTRILHGL